MWRNFGPFTTVRFAFIYALSLRSISIWALSVGHISLYNTLVYYVYDWPNDWKVFRSHGCKTSPNRPPPHHRAWTFGGFCADVLGLVFSELLHVGLITPEYSGPADCQNVIITWLRFSILIPADAGRMSFLVHDNVCSSSLQNWTTYTKMFWLSK